MVKKTNITDSEREEIRTWIMENPNRPYSEFMAETKNRFAVTQGCFYYLKIPKGGRRLKKEKGEKRTVYLTIFSKEEKEVRGKAREVLKEFLDVLKDNGRVKFEMVEVTKESSKERYIEIREY